MVDIGNDNALAGVGGVDELAVSNVDTHMEDAAGTAVIGEEEQIAGEQVGLLDGTVQNGPLVSCTGLQAVAEVLVDVVDKAGAVKFIGP